jgi:hypothetical protein
MSRKTFLQFGDGTSTLVKSIDISTFITGATTSPTPNPIGSYARFQQIGSLVQIEFKYIFLTVPTTGNMSINLPVSINTNYTKPQGIFHIRYDNSPGTGKVHYGFYNDNNANSIHLVAQLTFGGIPAGFTNSSPDTLVIGDILTGLIIYESND